MSAQADTNNLPYSTVDKTIRDIKKNGIKAEITLGQVLDVLQDTDKSAVLKLRSVQIGEAVDAFAAEKDVQETGMRVSRFVLP